MPASNIRLGIAEIGIPAAIVIGLAVLAAFWALTDPRADISAIKSSYLTIREHDEFKTRIDRDIAGIRTDIAGHERVFVSQREFENWVHERDKYATKTDAQINRIEATRPTQGELNIAVKALEIRIEALEREARIRGTAPK